MTTRRPAQPRPDSEPQIGGDVPLANGPRTLWARLRPFVRRDLGTRVSLAAASVVAVLVLAWLTTASIVWSDAERGRDLRVALGLERWEQASCGAPPGSACTYDDEEQAQIDLTFRQETAVRAAILDDLALRLEAIEVDLRMSQDILAQRSLALSVDSPFGKDPELADRLTATVDLAPLQGVAPSMAWDVGGALWEPVQIDLDSDASSAEIRSYLDSAISARLSRVATLKKVVALLRDANHQEATAIASVDRRELFEEAFAIDDAAHSRLAAWIVQVGHADQASENLAWALQSARPMLADAISRSTSPVWADRLDDSMIQAELGYAPAELEESYGNTSLAPFVKAGERYSSPLGMTEALRLFGTMLLALAAFLLVVASPVTTAVATAREREAGTLPVLRMTGLTAHDLALAMVVGPNVYNMVAGFSVLLMGVGAIGMSVGLVPSLLPVALILVLAASTHAIAIGLGDALGQRVNAMVVGAILGAAVVVPGMFGTLLTVFDATATGFALGPIPAVLSSIGEVSGLAQIGMHLDSHDGLGTSLLAYSIGAQLLLGIACLRTWSRRVEQPWAPLFQPAEGLTLAMACIGGAALCMLELAPRWGARDFDGLNALTFLAIAAASPIVIALLIASLRRPARASAVPDHVEARFAFGRFQLVLLTAVALLGATYAGVVSVAGTQTQDTELMWATLAQGLLVLETAAATFLWSSRRRERKIAALATGAVVVTAQLVAVAVVYVMEGRFVARFSQPAMPLMLGSNISNYWFAALLLLWGAGAAIVAAALIADRREAKANAQGSATGGSAGGDGTRDQLEGGRWLH